MKKLCRLAILLVLTSTVLLSACGKFSTPEPIEGSGYPNVYPKR